VITNQLLYQLSDAGADCEGNVSPLNWKIQLECGHLLARDAASRQEVTERLPSSALSSAMFLLLFLLVRLLFVFERRFIYET
jgi:hypothetical protein